MVKPPPDPYTSLYDLISFYLRFLRIQKNLRQHDVAEILGCSIGQVSKYETGEKQLDSADCIKLDNAWKTGGLFSILLFYARLGPDPTWPQRVKRFQRAGVEHKILNTTFIPIPFQTEDYARALLHAGYVAGNVLDVDGAVARRMELQAAILDGDPQIWLLLDTPGLRPMGSREMMRSQLDRVLELSQALHISVRILPDAATPHIAVDGSFWWTSLPRRRLMVFAGGALEVGRVIDDQAAALRAGLQFDRLAARAWNEDQTREHLMRLREDA
ncbi:helix-turn-helix domain-containing protein [Actinomadura rupiterrae]|uniref:helix-turn-helix domain-containing protein n=1 Tax=Actinomadura rupiterrae TaxID=559627 RepID=UPI0020A48BCE|nr:helix-turn-helix transcriptional regulator [Actinomadura rupiterrae]MCP2340273.1 transcriptional regulator with XRE-family HTH domain [Actinomadura rupiterrae]